MRTLFGAVLVVLVVLLNVNFALAGTATYNLGSNLGAVAYTYNQSEGTCSFYSEVFW